MTTKEIQEYNEKRIILYRPAEINNSIYIIITITYCIIIFYCSCVYYK